MTRLARWVAVLVLLAGTSCQVTLAAGVEANPDGSGVVRAALGLDDEARAQLGDPAKELRIDDLRQAGWDVHGPAKERDGLTWVRVSKGFASADDARIVAADLSGPDGPFRDFRLKRTRSFLKTTTVFTGTVDLSKGLAGLTDADVQQRLQGANLGLSLDALRARYGPALDQVVRVQVEASLPGRTRTWQPHVGEQLPLRSSVSSWNVQPILAAIAALLFATIALVVVAAARRHP